MTEAAKWLWVLCPCCLGTGFAFVPKKKLCWPCPHCEGVPHPALGPAVIKIHQRKKS